MSPSWTALLGWALLTAAAAAQAHVASNGFLSLEVRGRTLEGSLEIAVRDAELAVGVDALCTWRSASVSQCRAGAARSASAPSR